MKVSRLHKTIIRFLNKEANKSDLDQLGSSMDDDNAVRLFNQLVRVDYLISLCMKKYDLGKAKQSVNKKLKAQERKRKFNNFKYVSVAASIVFIAGILLYNMDKESSEGSNLNVQVDQIIESGSDKAILTLEDGTEVALQKGENYTNEKLSSNGEEVVYNGAHENNGLTYNYLTIPRGGQFFIKLSDGTKVWVNSDSKLKYPTSFPSGKQREVELLYGEAYFEVSPSEKHNGASFNVMTKDQNVTVLGTEFNIRAYKNEVNVVTTLSEGLVDVEQHNVKKRLRPNQQSITTENSSQVTIHEVDASVITSWVRGLFIFEDENLHEMMDDLSRWYDVEVFFESQRVRNISFTGVLERTKSLNELLEIIEASGEGDVSFTIKDKILIIK